MTKRNWGALLLAVLLLGWAPLGCTRGEEEEYGQNRPVRTPVAVDTSTPAPTGAPATPGAGGTPGGAAGADLQPAIDAGMPGVDQVPAQSPAADSPEAREKGKALFVTNCAPCHGDNGTGGGPAAAALDPQPRDLTKAAEYKYGTSDRAVFRTARYGVPDTGMAPWEGRLSDDDLWNIVLFVKSLQS